jgi:hypothetical protein
LLPRSYKEEEIDYQFNLDSLSTGSGLSKSLLKKLIADVRKEFPNDPTMQELHLRRYVDYEKNIKPQLVSKRKAH